MLFIFLISKGNENVALLLTLFAPRDKQPLPSSCDGFFFVISCDEQMCVLMNRKKKNEIFFLCQKFKFFSSFCSLFCTKILLFPFPIAFLIFYFFLFEKETSKQITQNYWVSFILMAWFFLLLLNFFSSFLSLFETLNQFGNFFFFSCCFLHSLFHISGRHKRRKALKKERVKKGHLFY